MTTGQNIDKILKWNKVHSFAILIASIVSLYSQSLFIFALTSGFSFSYYIANHLSLLKLIKPFGGVANWITAFRLVLLLIAIIYHYSLPSFSLITILISFVCLDALDGWAARKYQQTTVFGQYFDMEVDALFVFFCCILIYMKGISSAWILIPGALRYIFVLYTIMFENQNNNKTEKRSNMGATIAVVFFISLLISLSFQNMIQDVLLKVSASLIVFSFGLSFYNHSRT